MVSTWNFVDIATLYRNAVKREEEIKVDIGRKKMEPLLTSSNYDRVKDAAHKGQLLIDVGQVKDERCINVNAYIRSLGNQGEPFSTSYSKDGTCNVAYRLY